MVKLGAFQGSISADNKVARWIWAWSLAIVCITNALSFVLYRVKNSQLYWFCWFFQYICIYFHFFPIFSFGHCLWSGACLMPLLCFSCSLSFKRHSGFYCLHIKVLEVFPQWELQAIRTAVTGLSILLFIIYTLYSARSVAGTLSLVCSTMKSTGNDP